jgi:asparagine synthase (glutamine-hydrolysing)
VDTWSRGDAILAVTRAGWEFGQDFAGEVGVHEAGDLVVTADASLYYRDDLSGRLRAAGVRAEGDTPSHLIAAAYRAWGRSLAERLEGDFAFCVWDKQRERIVAARDLMGARPLFWARASGSVAVASSVRALTRLPGCSRALNLASLGIQAGGMLWSSGADTVFRDVQVVRPAHRLVAEDDRVRVERYWDPPRAPSTDGREAAGAALELRALLEDATRERLSEGHTTVWMSGGRDSTAVFAAGQSALSESGEGRRLQPVSISYPPDDPGHEDPVIRDVAERWDASVHWLDIAEIPLLEGLPGRAARYDEPPAHLYDLWNRALARGTRTTGSRVALDGSGGDNLFAVSSVRLADHLASGRWIRLARDAWPQRHRGLRSLARFGVLPLLPDWSVRTGERLLGRGLPRHYLERRPAPWIRDDFIEQHGLRERELEVLRGMEASSRGQQESLLLISAPIWGWGGSFMRKVLLEEGVEVRSPLLDRRIMEFALSRPLSERFANGESKRLLRHAMEGLLPDSVLDPRRFRTGATVGYSRSRMRAIYPDLFEEMFSRPLRLAELGVVDREALRRATEEWRSGGDAMRVRLFHTMKVEFWLRGLEAEADTAPPEASSSEIEAMTTSAA